jgi:hypothetical protein
MAGVFKVWTWSDALVGTYHHVPGTPKGPEESCVHVVLETKQLFGRLGLEAGSWPPAWRRQEGAGSVWYLGGRIWVHSVQWARRFEGRGEDGKQQREICELAAGWYDEVVWLFDLMHLGERSANKTISRGDRAVADRIFYEGAKSFSHRESLSTSHSFSFIFYVGIYRRMIIWVS